MRRPRAPQRYSADYEVITCSTTADAAARLSALGEADARVALVIAGVGGR